MPTPRGLEIAQHRHHFRTIINLFPEETPQRSPLLEDELKFAREHDIHYVASPSDPSPAASNTFLDQTLALGAGPHPPGRSWFTATAAWTARRPGWASSGSWSGDGP